MKILIADDHSLVREGLKTVLADLLPGSTVVAVGSLPAAVTAVEERGPFSVAQHRSGDRLAQYEPIGLNRWIWRLRDVELTGPSPRPFVLSRSRPLSCTNSSKIAL